MMSKIKDNKLFLKLVAIISIPFIILGIVLIFKPDFLTKSFGATMAILIIIIILMLSFTKRVKKKVLKNISAIQLRREFKKIDASEFKKVYKKTYRIRHKRRVKKKSPEIRYFLQKNGVSEKPKYFTYYDKVSNSYTTIDTSSEFYLIQLRTLLDKGGKKNV